MAVKGNIRKKHKKTEVSRVEETVGTDVDGKLKKKKNRSKLVPVQYTGGSPVCYIKCRTCNTNQKMETGQDLNFITNKFIRL